MKRSLSVFLSLALLSAQLSAETPRIQPRGTDSKHPDQVKDWPTRIVRLDPGSQTLAWAKGDFDHSKWKSMTLPVHIEKAGHPEFDGVIWFRRTIEVSKEMCEADALLSLGAIDDMDVTWVNGKRVGGYEQPGAHYTPRNYKLKKGLLTPGKNTIAVRVFDHGWGGGIAGTHGKMELSSGTHKLALTGSWRYHLGATLAVLNSPPKAVADTPRAEPLKDKFSLSPNEVIAFAGGSHIVKHFESGYLEYLLTLSTRDPIFFRDIAWQTDTVYRQQRPRNFGTHLDLLRRSQTSMIIANYGQMEALDGASKVGEFIQAYDKLLAEFAQQTPRIVLLAPHPFGKLTNPHLPNLQRRNGDLAAYTEAIKALAKERGYLFVDSGFTPNESQSSDGLQLNLAGHRAWAEAVASKLLSRQVKIRASDEKIFPLPGVHKVIHRKNVLWRQHWRPTNWSFLYGNRQHVPSSHDHRPGKGRWFPEEVDRIITLIEREEATIRSYQENPR